MTEPLPQLSTLNQTIDRNQPIVIDTETTGENPHTADLLFYKSSPKISDLSELPGKFLVGHNLKYDLIVLNKTKGLNLQIGFDTLIAYYLLYIEKFDKKNKGKLEKILKSRFNIDKEDLIQLYNRLTGKDVKKTLPENWWLDLDRSAFETYGQADVDATQLFFDTFSVELRKRGLEKWFYDVEMPFANIILQSELKGVKIDTVALTNLKTTFQTKVEQLEKDLKTLAKNPNINLNSSQQIDKLLFGTFRLRPLGKTKSGANSTDAKILTKMKNQHPFIPKLLEYKTINKLLTTYTDSLLTQLDNLNRIHTTYNLTMTETRRLSSDSPNLQNIPVKTENGKLIRQCFVPEQGHSFLILDYDQIELRLLAEFSKDPTLIKWFNERRDIHAQTAGLIALKLNRKFERRDGKLLNFSLLYGKTEYGFAKDWNVSLEEARNIIKVYFEQFQNVKKWKDKQEYLVAENKGFTKSLAGLPLYCGNPMMDNFDQIKRYAVNYPIQASSQDILKYSVVKVYEKYGLVPLLLVHDELVYEIPNEKLTNELKYDIIRIMTQEPKNKFQMSVNLEVTSKVSNKWEK